MYKGWMMLLLLSLTGLTFACETGWTSYGTKCLKLLTVSTTANVSESSFECRKLDAGLVRIDSVEKMNFVLATWTNQSIAFLDGTDNGQEGKWTYFDGTPMNYFKWRDDEPNNVHNGENCIEMIEGEWNDMTCSGLIHHEDSFVMCEKSVIPSERCGLDGMLRKFPDTYMYGQEIESLEDLSHSRCVSACFRAFPDCVSLNYRPGGEPGVNCVLNKASRLEHANALTPRSGWQFEQRIFEF